MVPFTLMSCCLISETQSEEMRIIDVSSEGFSFRCARSDTENIYNVKKIKIFFFDMDIYQYKELELGEFEIKRLRGSKFYSKFKIITDDPAYIKNVQKLMADYTEYAELKNAQGDLAAAFKYTGYNEDGACSETFEKQKRKWLDGKRAVFYNKSIFTGRSLGIIADTPVCYRYLTEHGYDSFCDYFWSANGFEADKLSKAYYVYLGNQFCPELFPDTGQLIKMLDIVCKAGAVPVVSFSYIRESEQKRMADVLAALELWCRDSKKKLELTVNDWGMLSFINNKKYDCFELTLGILLAKRRKDTRYIFKKGFEAQSRLYADSTVNAEFFQRYLLEHFNISRISYEMAGYRFNTAKKLKGTLFMPFYQMNTSSFCPYSAVKRYGKRSAQELPVRCGFCCLEKNMLYPDKLHMTAQYNSLFGFDEEGLKNTRIIADYLNNGIDRIAVGFF